MGKKFIFKAKIIKESKPINANHVKLRDYSSGNGFFIQSFKRVLNGIHGGKLKFWFSSWYYQKSYKKRCFTEYAFQYHIGFVFADSESKHLSNFFHQVDAYLTNDSNMVILR